MVTYTLIGTPFMTKIGCSSSEIGILARYWFCTNYSTSGIGSSWITLIASPFFLLEINGSNPWFPNSTLGTC